MRLVRPLALVLLCILIISSIVYASNEEVYAINYKLLYSYDIIDDQINALGQKVFIIQGLIEEGISKDEVHQAVECFISPKRKANLSNESLEIPPIPAPPYGLRSKDGYAALERETGRGCYWYVDSITGYNEATGFCMLSDATIHLEENVKHTVPYFFFGAFNTSTGIYSEIGLCYVNGSWRPFYNIGDGTGWHYGDGSIPANHDAYIIFEVKDDQLYYEIIDTTAGWEEVDSNTLDVSSSANYNDEGTNMRIYRQTTFAQDPPQDLDCEAYFLDGEWNTVYIYNKEGYYSKWYSNKTNDTHEYDGTHSDVTVVNSYYEDICDFDYR